MVQKGVYMAVGNKLYIGNISYHVTSEDVAEYLSQYGTVVDANVICDSGGQSKGFGFAEMSNPEEANIAVENLDGITWEGRKIKVSIAIDKKSQIPVKEYKSEYSPGTTNLYVGNIPFHMSEDELTSIFSVVGPVRSAKIVRDIDTRKSKGYGFVEMEKPEHAEQALKLINGKVVGGRPVNVNSARERIKK